jgi:hypothetical protein
LVELHKSPAHELSELRIEQGIILRKPRVGKDVQARAVNELMGPGIVQAAHDLLADLNVRLHFDPLLLGGRRVAVIAVTGALVRPLDVVLDQADHVLAGQTPCSRLGVRFAGTVAAEVLLGGLEPCAPLEVLGRAPLLRFLQAARPSENWTNVLPNTGTRCTGTRRR